jgi:Zn finger protein HypA/HybF involved in hydrogenase expression
VTGTWVVVALLAPPAAAALAAVYLRPRNPSPWTVTGLNAALPGAGLAAAGRSTLEVVFGVMFAQASLILAGSAGEPWMYVPPMLVGGAWARVTTPLNPLARLVSIERHFERVPADRGSASPAARSPETSVTTRSGDEAETVIESQYSVEVRCTECGAAVAVPVLHHMAKCSFCGSRHLVVGHEETLYVTLPERVYDGNVLREALLDHYRYQHYLKLYARSVAPLARQATEASPSGALVSRPEVDAAINAAEAAVSRKADAFRSKLAGSLHVGRVLHFLTPYRHGMGTLYQATFGRSPHDAQKLLRFDIGTVEAAISAAADVALPAMGKLSYLRALRPAAELAPDLLTLPLDGDDDELARAFGHLDRKQLARDVQVIRLGSRFTREVTAVVWRPWWVAEVRGPGIDENVLLDGAAGSVIKPAPRLDPGALVELPPPAREAGTGLRFVPMECPTCGHEFSFDTDAVLHFCRNCHRVCGVVGGRKEVVPYGHVPTPDEPGWDLVPFWRFPLNLRTGDGRTLTDLMQLKDGIDGTLDQIGDEAPHRQHVFYVPAIRCINPRLMTNAFNRLFLYAIRNRPPKELKRYPLEERPEPWTISLCEAEARDIAPLYLANVFSRRDIARVNVHQVAAWLFDAEQASAGHLMYLPVPQPVTEPFRRYLGRYRDDAVRAVTGRA